VGHERESLLQQRSQQELHVRGRSWHCRWNREIFLDGVDIETVTVHPALSADQLKALNPIRHRDQRAHRHSGYREAAARLQPEADALQVRSRRALLDGRDLELHIGFRGRSGRRCLFLRA
jgi:hypothetical protein